MIRALIASLLVCSPAGCARTSLQTPYGSYVSDKNVRIEAAGVVLPDGTKVDSLQIIGDASGVIDSQVEAVKAGVELGRQIGGLP